MAENWCVRVLGLLSAPTEDQNRKQPRLASPARESRRRAIRGTPPPCIPGWARKPHLLMLPQHQVEPPALTLSLFSTKRLRLVRAPPDDCGDDVDASATAVGAGAGAGA